MMEFWQFMFQDFWHWLGLMLPLLVICVTVTDLFTAIVKRASK